jgi:hypothetical protein
VNKPAWAQFDPSTGRLSGTPGPVAAGSYTGIKIRATDGVASASLPVFSITVQQSANGSARLSWLPPTTRVDGSPLTNLRGYRIRYGTAPDRLSNLIEIPHAGITSAVIENLAPATYYFVMSAYDADGLESSDTAPVSKTIG